MKSCIELIKLIHTWIYLNVFIPQLPHQCRTLTGQGHSVPEPHVPVLRDFIKLTKSLNDFFALSSEARSTSIIRKKQKEAHVPVLYSKEITFAVIWFEPKILCFLVSDAPTRPYCSQNLNICHSSWYICTKASSRPWQWHSCPWL
jgi:hypothetical protein